MTRADMNGGTPIGRTLVVWCPDWPAVAAARHAGHPVSDPVAVFHANRVQACTTTARNEGVHLGQRRRDAQSRCPDLHITRADPDRDARLFEPVAAAVETIAPGVEILRPGVLACSARGPARYFGSEIAAAEKIVDTVESLDVECRVGVADVLAVAVLAARSATIVPPAGSAEFCAPLPITELARDPAISPPERAVLTDLLVRLGITTIGAFAALPEIKVATRFGADAVQAHRLARGSAERGVSRRQIPDELTVEQTCDPPLDRIDTAAFAARALADRFHTLLADAGLACTRLAITADTERGARLSRIWRCAKPLTAAATADRLRWQLDGWLTAGRTARPGDLTEDGYPQGPGAIVRLTLEPVEAIGAGLIQYGLWGSDGQDDQRAGWAFARVQGLLGPESVVTPVLSGGRGPADRITLVPWGEEKTAARDPSAPWPGALPAPSPTRLATSDPEIVTVLDAAGRPVVFTGRGLLTGSPSWIDQHGERQHVDAWAGPWVLDERWWAADKQSADGGPAILVNRPTRYLARLQVVTDEGVAMLMRFGATGWQLEGVYD
ncbi:MAG TPA: DNA polymerase Y family protein [Nakamurella sp.]|nr:DNA polymerase Y family protein [Nakamurella sp.]